MPEHSAGGTQGAEHKARPLGAGAPLAKPSFAEHRVFIPAALADNAGLAASERRPFALQPDLMQTAAGGEPGPPIMGLRLLDLLAAARVNIVDLESRALTGIRARLAAVADAADRFALAPGVPLSDFLWTSRCKMQEALAASKTDGRAAGRPGGSELLLLFADDAGPHGLLSARAAPLRVRDGIAGDLTVPGPYLALVAYEHDGLGQGRAVRGFAQAVQGPDCFMPVRSAFERDVLAVLMRLQERLDERGWSLAFARGLSGPGPDARIVISIAKPHGALSCLEITCAANGAKDMPGHGAPGFTVTPASLADGGFAGWLEKNLVQGA